MQLFTAYIKQRQKDILVFFLLCAIYSLCLWLYQLPIAAIGYPILLCTFFGTIFFLIDFFKIRHMHQQLMSIYGQAASVISSMPAATSIESADYQTIIHGICQELADVETQASANFQETVEYYTIWVHQIKTPITSMRLALEQEDTPLSRKLTSDLFQIEQYVEMVLAFLRLGSESGDYLFKEQPLDDIIKSAIAKFASEFIDRKIHLDYSPTNVTVITDEKWLSLCIEQILSNALKYTRTGSIKIYLEPEKTLCIADTGIGIAPADLPRVFEKGYTGYNGRTDKRASGIGLYLCRQILDRLSAEINITSQLDKGTTVRIHLEQYPLKPE